MFHSKIFDYMESKKLTKRKKQDNSSYLRDGSRTKKANLPLMVGWLINKNRNVYLTFMQRML